MLVREFQFGPQKTEEKQTGSNWNDENRTLQKVTGRTGRSSKSFGWLSSAAATLLTAVSVLPDWIQMWRKDERRLKTERWEGKRNIFLRSYWCNLKKQLQVDMKQESRIDSKKKWWFLLDVRGKLLSHVKMFSGLPKQRWSVIRNRNFPKPKRQDPGWKTAACMDVRLDKANMFP